MTIWSLLAHQRFVWSRLESNKVYVLSLISNFQQEVLWCLYEESHACSSRRMHQVLCAWIYIDIAWCWLHLLGTGPAVIAQLTPAKTTRAWMGYDVYCAPLTITSVLSLAITRLFVSITWWSSMKDCSLPDITQYLSFLWEFNHTVRVKPLVHFPLLVSFQSFKTKWSECDPFWMFMTFKKAYQFINLVSSIFIVIILDI